MGQAGFFDLERRLDALSAKGDPLETIISSFGGLSVKLLTLGGRLAQALTLEV